MIALIAALTAGVAIAAWREWTNTRRIRQLVDTLADAVDQKHQAQEAANTAYATGFNDGIDHTRRVVENEIESARRNGYTRGLADAARQKVRAA